MIKYKLKTVKDDGFTTYDLMAKLDDQEMCAFCFVSDKPTEKEIEKAKLDFEREMFYTFCYIEKAKGLSNNKRYNEDKYK